jgi:hypothetical protein
LGASWADKAMGIKPEHASANARRAIFETREYMRFSSTIESWKTGWKWHLLRTIFRLSDWLP